MIEKIEPDEAEAAKIALIRKPRGKQARAFYDYVLKICNESSYIIFEQNCSDKDRLSKICAELNAFHYPAVASLDEYNIAMSSDLFILNIEYILAGGSPSHLAP